MQNYINLTKVDSKKPIMQVYVDISIKNDCVASAL